jgi:AraC-like DNA-binding protein
VTEIVTLGKVWRVAKVVSESLLPKGFSVLRRPTQRLERSKRGCPSAAGHDNAANSQIVLSAIEDYLAFCFARHERPQVDELAKRLGISRSTLTLTFHHERRQAIGSYLRRRLIDHVKYLLDTTNLRVARIGAQAGFRSERSFHRAFRRATGTTPDAYRQRRTS